ncbi:MAG: YlbF family regulator [Gemmatimonadota bacterium]
MIEDKALEVGRLIGQSPEYQALRRTETALRNDADTVAKLDKIQELARQIDKLVAAGTMPEDELTVSYETAVRDLELSAIGQAYVVARANFDKLMRKVNDQMSAGIDRGAQSSIISLG